jgi:Short C-terminal domain
MRRTIATLLGFAACAVFTYELLQLVKTGTCASGGPYAIARPCPSGTGAEVLLLTLSIIVAVVAMIAGGGLLVWCALFLSSGIGMLTYALVATNPGPGAKTAGYTVGFTFILMGGIPLLYLIGSGVSRLRDRPRRRAPAEPSITAAVQQLQRGGVVQASTRTSSASSVAPAAPSPVAAPAVPAGYAAFTMPAPAVARPRRDPLEQLEQLAALRDSGALTAAEFDAQKTKLLAEI